MVHVPIRCDGQLLPFATVLMYQQRFTPMQTSRCSPTSELQCDIWSPAQAPRPLRAIPALLLSGGRLHVTYNTKSMSPFFHATDRSFWKPCPNTAQAATHHRRQPLYLNYCTCNCYSNCLVKLYVPLILSPNNQSSMRFHCLHFAQSHTGAQNGANCPACAGWCCCCMLLQESVLAA